MPSPHQLLPWLLGGAVGLGGILQGLHWRSTGSSGAIEGLENQLRIAEEENAMLQRENEALRSLAQGGGELAVPPELIARVEQELGLHFLSSPVVHRIASEELRDRISAAYESRFGPSGIDYRQEAYALIGWLSPQDRLLTQLTLLRAVGSRGWFDDVTGEGWVTDRFDPENVPDQATLVLLLTRCLLHQHYPPSPSYPGDDADRAREALHQGAAASGEARYYAHQARTNGFMSMTDSSDVEQLLLTLPPFLQELAIFPSTAGRGLADALYAQGPEALQEAFRNPPQTTRAILLPGAPAAAPAPLDLPASEEEPFLVETAGQLGLRLWLEPLGDVGAAAEIASFWKNDRYMLIPEGEVSSAVVWDIELENEAAADQLEALAGSLLAAMAAQDSSADVGTTVITPEGRHLTLTRVSPTRLRYRNTAS